MLTQQIGHEKLSFSLLIELRFRAGDREEDSQTIRLSSTDSFVSLVSLAPSVYFSLSTPSVKN